MSRNLTFVFAENVLVSDTCKQRTLRKEIMILEVLEAQEPAVFRRQKNVENPNAPLRGDSVDVRLLWTPEAQALQTHDA
jgi:hypothetical protein